MCEGLQSSLKVAVSSIPPENTLLKACNDTEPSCGSQKASGDLVLSKHVGGLRLPIFV